MTRALSDGGYTERFETVATAKRHLGVDKLSLLDDDDLKSAADLGGPAAGALHHVVSEHRRVEKAIVALKGDDPDAFGALMDESHRSIRDDFAIVPPQVDEMVRFSREAGALGARLTGGGFGGCFVALVPEEDVPAFADTLSERSPNTRRVA